MSKDKICGRCYQSVNKLFPANCKEKPELLKGQPIGQYHCPDCGAMLLAGMPHFELCESCKDGSHEYLEVKMSPKDMERKCKNCKYGNKHSKSDYCGKILNDGKPYSYDYYLPKNSQQLNRNGGCIYYKPKFWFGFWRAK